MVQSERGTVNVNIYVHLAANCKLWTKGLSDTLQFSLCALKPWSNFSWYVIYFFYDLFKQDICRCDLLQRIIIIDFIENELWILKEKEAIIVLWNLKIDLDLSKWNLISWFFIIMRFFIIVKFFIYKIIF